MKHGIQTMSQTEVSIPEDCAIYPFGTQREKVATVLADLNNQNRMYPSTEAGIAVLCILAGKGYSQSRLERVSVKMRYAESVDITDEGVIEMFLHRCGIVSPTALHIAQNALIVAGELPKEMPEVHKSLVSDGVDKMLEKHGQVHTGK